MMRFKGDTVVFELGDAELFAETGITVPTETGSMPASELIAEVLGGLRAALLERAELLRALNVRAEKLQAVSRLLLEQYPDLTPAPAAPIAGFMAAQQWAVSHPAEDL